MTRTITTTRLSLDLSSSRLLTYHDSVTPRIKSDLPNPITSSTLDTPIPCVPHPQDSVPNPLFFSDNPDDQHVEPLMADISSLLETMHSKNLTLKKFAKKQVTLINALRTQIESLKSDNESKDRLIASTSHQLALLQQQAQFPASEPNSSPFAASPNNTSQSLSPPQAFYSHQFSETNIIPNSCNPKQSTPPICRNVRSPLQKGRWELACTVKLALDGTMGMTNRLCSKESIITSSSIMSTLSFITRSIVRGTVLALVPVENRAPVGVALLSA